jgi:hypothetical protein
MDINQPISIQYDEWLGTAVADDDIPIHDFYEEVGLDRDEWHIVGWEIFPKNDDTLVTVLATKKEYFEYDRDSHGSPHESWLAAIREAGSLPVHRIHVVADVDKIFKRFGVRLFTSALVKNQLPVEVVGELDLRDGDV